MTNRPFRWGILGTGTIAGKFAEGLRAVPDAALVAVGSRRLETAQAFAARHGASRCHGSYEALARDPDLDAVYVSSPHTGHREHAMLCLEHGRAVLCEKPFAMHRREAEAMVALARTRGVFLMEGMWTHFHPVMVKLRELLAAGALGEVRYLQADFGFRAPFDPAARLFDPALGGGALLDVGVYCVSLAHMVFGGPADEYVGMAALGETRVDEQSAWIGRWSGGRLGVMSSAIRTETPQEAVICGTDGSVRIPRFWSPSSLCVDGVETAFDLRGNGYNYEAEEVARCVRAGRTESETLTLDQSLAVMGDLDRLRAPWGLRYPAD